MVHYCIVSDCDKNFKRNASQNDRTFHRIPKDKRKRLKWFNAIGIKDFNPASHLRICSLHFNDTDFVPDRRRKTLRSGAIPSCSNSVKPCTQVFLCIKPENENKGEIGLEDKNDSFEKDPLGEIQTPQSPDDSDDHNYSYTGSIKDLKQHCDFLIKSLEEKQASETRLRIALRRMEASNAKLKAELQCLRKRDNSRVSTKKRKKECQLKVETRAIKRLK